MSKTTRMTMTATRPPISQKDILSEDRRQNITFTSSTSLDTIRLFVDIVHLGHGRLQAPTKPIDTIVNLGE